MSIAKKLYDRAFSGARDPRSDAYKSGVLSALMYRSGEGPSPKEHMPFVAGTAEFDAWCAGLDEGYNRWRIYAA